MDISYQDKTDLFYIFIFMKVFNEFAFKHISLTISLYCIYVCYMTSNMIPNNYIYYVQSYYLSVLLLYLSGDMNSQE